MTENLQINTRVKRLIQYIEEIDNGYIQIPSFQRDFIWENKQKLDLFESIRRGYPIGSLLLWKPTEKYGVSDAIGPYPLQEPRMNEYYYILDGFQRLSTIYGCLKNPKKNSYIIDENLRNKKYSIYYDLITEEFFVPRSIYVELTQIPVYTLVDTFEFLTYASKLQNDYPDKDNALLFLDRAKKLTATFSDYTLPSIEIVGGKIEDAIEIFTRINSKGSEITTDWMLSALTNNELKNFNLGGLINKLLIELEEFNFGEIKRELIVQCIQNSFGKVYFDTKIEDLHSRKEFIDITNRTINSIKKAIKFLFEELLVVSIKLLPYNNQLIFITDFFNKVNEPTKEQLAELKDWFWKTTYANYFTIYSLSKIREAYNQFQLYIQGKSNEILYNDKPENPFSVVDFPNKIYLGSVRAKALVLFLLNKANGFKSICSNNTYNLVFYNIFSIKREDGNYPPEGVLPMLEDNACFEFLKNITGSKKPKDLSSFLLQDNFSQDFSKYFLTKEMINLMLNNNTNEILKLRKELIIKAEKEFVEIFGLKYDY